MKSYSCQSPTSGTEIYTDPVTALSVSLWSSLPLTGGRIIGLGLASVLKHTYTL